MQQFELVLKNEKTKFYKTLFLFFIALNLGFLLVNAFYAAGRTAWVAAGGCLLLTAVGFTMEHFMKKKGKVYSGKGAAVTFLFFAYVKLKFWWPAAAILLIAALYYISVRQLVVYVNPNRIIYPSFPKRELAWNHLNNIVLKDGILTVDFKNNKLAQAEVINGENDYDLDEKEFNAFCRQQLDMEHR